MTKLALLTLAAGAAFFPATATAQEPSVVIRIPRTLFLKMLEGYPDAARNLRDAMAARLEEWNKDLAGVKAKLEGAANGKD